MVIHFCTAGGSRLTRTENQPEPASVPSRGNPSGDPSHWGNANRSPSAYRASKEEPTGASERKKSPKLQIKSNQINSQMIKSTIIQQATERKKKEKEKGKKKHSKLHRTQEPTNPPHAVGRRRGTPSSQKNNNNNTVQSNLQCGFTLFAVTIRGHEGEL